MPSIVEASYGNNPGFFVLIFGADALVNFGMTIAVTKDGYPVISSYWLSQEPRQQTLWRGSVYLREKKYCPMMLMMAPIMPSQIKI
ncbi:hypothetical protein OAI23_01890 [Alphaproteobacteria bacterium]|nr:hypothetical protein [Alphaproteobacteria bacterium]